MKNNILLLCAMCLLISCVEEQRFENFNPTPGVEVKFSAATEINPETRTLYGADADELTGLRVKWVNGDKIKVYGTTCSIKEAEYAVKATTATSNTPNTDDGQNYADDLAKTGAAGVQWGSNQESDFYAIYPSEGASFSQDGSGNVTIKTTIAATQNYLFNNEPNAQGIWEGTHFGSDATDPSMANAIMYACTKGATATDKDGNPKQVDLHFKPFSTVLKFRFVGYATTLDNPTVYIQNIQITAPEGTMISGDFNLAIAGSGGKNVSATASLAGNNTNSVTLNTMLPGGTYVPLKQNQALEFNVFTIPLADQKMGGNVTREYLLDEKGNYVQKVDENGNKVTDNNGNAVYETVVTCAKPWKVTINTQGHGSFTYTVIPNVDGITNLQVGQTLSAKTYIFDPGHIHKIKIPQLMIKSKVEWNPENWIQKIPVPVYISELSVPGAWYCFDSGYQNTTDLTTLYNSGIRAFNIDCRITKKADTNDGFEDRLILSDYYYEEQWRDSDYPANSYLACAGTEKNDDGHLAGKYSLTDGVYVETAVKDIIDLAQDHLDEYVVIVFSFAEKPKTVNYLSTQKYGTINPIWIQNEINKILNTKGIKEYLYTNISKDTTIEDILTKQDDGYIKNVIVKINHCIDNFYETLVEVDNDNNASTDLVSVIPEGIMGSFGSMSSNSDYNLSDDIITNIAGLHAETSYNNYFTAMQTDDIYVGDTKSNMVYCYHQAQQTSSSQDRNQQGTGIPSLGMRMDAIDDIIYQSKIVYDSAMHDHWFQLGIGGSLNGDDPSGVSDVLNPYLYAKITKKMNTDPSPVGIVLMNHATSTTKNLVTVDGTEYNVSSQDLVKAIIEMNGKFYLNREGGSVTTGNGENSGNGTSSSQAKNGAYAIVGEDAF